MTLRGMYPAWQGFLTTETARALEYFEEATECFKKALAEVSCAVTGQIEADL